MKRPIHSIKVSVWAGIILTKDMPNPYTIIQPKLGYAN